MATLASTQVTSVDALAQPQPLGGLSLQMWKVAMGAVGDTATITPSRGRFVVAAIGGPATSNTSANGTSTNVTLTLTSSAATNTTFDVALYVAD